MSDLTKRVKFLPIPRERNDAINRDFPNYKASFVRGEPGSILMGAEFWYNAKNIYNMKVRPDDVWIVTYPKCGTTWTQDMTWLICNNCDFEGAKVPLGKRSPYLEMSLLPGMSGPGKEEIRKMLTTVEDIEKMPSPRLIKSHLPFSLLPPDLLNIAKVVYVARNPKDVITSFYHHHQLMKAQNCIGDLELFAEYFMRDETVYGSFFQHVKGAWNKKDHPNLHFMFYEEMKKNLRGEIQKLASFLGKPLTHEQKDDLVQHLSFKNFKENKAVNNEIYRESGFFNKDGHFIRKGEIGDWKNHFSPSLNERIDKWIEDNLANTTLTFRLQ